MKKLITILGPLLVITVSFLFILAKIQAQGSEDNYFNRQWRPRLAQYPILRHLLGLHWDGDARADYLGDKYEKIFVEVDLADGQTVELAALDLLKEKMSAATGKPVSYLISDRTAPRRNYRNESDTAAVYLRILDRDPESPDTLGKTFEEYGIILYGRRLREFTDSAPATLNSYIASTALHEFGHLLGLPHNDRPGCLMNEHAEEGDVAWQRAQDVIIDFCEYEKELING